MTLPQIQDWYETTALDQKKLAARRAETLDEGTWKRVRRELPPYGLIHRGNVGYSFQK